MTTYRDKNKASPWDHAAPRTSLMSKQAVSVVDLEQRQRAVDKATSQKYVNRARAKQADDERKAKMGSAGIKSVWGAAPMPNIPFKHRSDAVRLQITPYSNIAVKNQKQDPRLQTVLDARQAQAGNAFSYMHRKQGYVPDKGSDAIWSGALAKKPKVSQWSGAGAWETRSGSPHATRMLTKRLAHQDGQRADPFSTPSFMAPLNRSRSPSINIPGRSSSRDHHYRGPSNPLNAFGGNGTTYGASHQMQTVKGIANGMIENAFDMPLPGVFDVNL